MRRLFPRLVLCLGASCCLQSAWAAEADAIYLSCRVKPSTEYVVRIDRLAEVMWVDGNRLKLSESSTEYVATEYSGEFPELRAEYRINRASGVLKRVSYGLNGTLGTREGVCKPAAKPALPKSLY
jgi:hypothetical protein